MADREKILEGLRELHEICKIQVDCIGCPVRDICEDVLSCGIGGRMPENYKLPEE